jgi:hypothetical protein
VIEDLPVVRSVCFHTGDKTHKSRVYDNLRCVCGVKQVGTVRKSSKRPTFGDCLRELGRLIQQDHVGSQSSDPHLLVTDCTRTKQTSWTEDQFTVTSSAGIRNREKRVGDIVVRELKRDKPGVWGCIQASEVWSS